MLGAAGAPSALGTLGRAVCRCCCASGAEMCPVAGQRAAAAGLWRPDQRRMARFCAQAKKFDAAVYMTSLAMNRLWSPHRLQWHALQAEFLMSQIAIKARVQLRCQLGASSHSERKLHSMHPYSTVYLDCSRVRLCNPFTPSLITKPESSKCMKQQHGFQETDRHTTLADFSSAHIATLAGRSARLLSDCRRAFLL